MYLCILTHIYAHYQWATYMHNYLFTLLVRQYYFQLINYRNTSMYVLAETYFWISLQTT